MSKDFRVATGFFAHKKTIRLIRKLGIKGPWYLLKLWAWAREHCPNGNLEDMTGEDIEDAINWDGERNAFISAITSEDTLHAVCIDDKYILHNWTKHNAWAAKAEERSEIARKNANKRWDKKDTECKPQCETDASGIQTPHAPSPSPSPSPSLSTTDTETQTCIELLRGIKDYPLEEKDIKFISSLVADYPKIDPVCIIKNWQAYILDVPFKKNARHRAQLKNQFELKMNQDKCQRKNKDETEFVDCTGRRLKII